MRLYQQIRASIARPAIGGILAFLFASGMSMSASGQTAARPAGQAPGATGATVPQGTPLSIDEAVKMALENNLGIQTEKLNPQIQVLGIARANAAYAPTLFSNLSRNSRSAPPSDFLSAGGASIVTNASFQTSGGLQQNM